LDWFTHCPRPAARASAPRRDADIPRSRNELRSLSSRELEYSGRTIASNSLPQKLTKIKRLLPTILTKARPKLDRNPRGTSIDEPLDVRIFRAPAFVQDALRIFASKIWGEPEPSVPDAIIILPDEDSVPSARISYKIREWRACNEETGRRLIETVREAFRGSRERNEATTGDDLIVPILRALEYSWTAQIYHGKNILYYEFSDAVALEIKKSSPKYDYIDALNDNVRFHTVAEQVVTYLDECNLTTMLYSNGAFWWRIERQQDYRQLHALRFNMRLAFNEIATHRTSQHLSRFTPLFHSKAFRPGNNYSIGIHQGLGQRIEPAEKIGLVWMKDLNNGYRNVGL